MITPKILTDITAKGRILFISADKNYSVFHLENGGQLVSGYTLKFHQNHLDIAQYLRVNRSMLVNKAFIRNIKEKSNASYLIMKNGRKVLISRRRLKLIQEECNLMR